MDEYVKKEQKTMQSVAIGGKSEQKTPKQKLKLGNSKGLKTKKEGLFLNVGRFKIQVLVQRVIIGRLLF